MNVAQRKQYEDITTNPFVVRFLNVDAFCDDRFCTIESAIDAGKRIGFEFSVIEQHVMKGSRLCGSWNVIGGWNEYAGSFHKII